MADSQQNPSQSDDRNFLVSALGKRTTDAIVGVARQVANEEIDMRMGELNTMVNDLADQQRAQIAAFRNLTPQQQSEVVDDVNDTTRVVRRAVEGQGSLAERQRSGEEVSSEELQQVEATTAEAQQKQADTERRLATATRVRKEHEATQAARTDPPKSDTAPAPSRDTIKDKNQGKGDDEFVTHGQLGWHLEQFSGRINESNDRSVRALAIASASARSVAPLRRAASWAMIAFVTVGVLYLLITGLTPLEHVWRDNFAWAFGAGFTAWCVGLITAKEASSNAEARSEARTGHDDAGIDVVRQQAHDDAVEDSARQLEERAAEIRRRHGSSASASAHASAR